MTNSLPAPEQRRTWPAYVNLCRTQLDKEDLTYYLKTARFNDANVDSDGHRWTLKQFFDECWADEDAEMLHQAWNELTASQ